MIRTARASQLATARRARLLRRSAPVAALAASGVTYGLHHTTPLDGHDLSVVALVVATAAVVAVAFAALADTAERPLPVVVTLEPGSTEMRAVWADDLDFSAALHAETLPHGFFAELGYRFLRAYLATFVASPHAVALLAAVQGAPVGTVFGILRPRAHRRWVLRHRGLRLALLGGLAPRDTPPGSLSVSRVLVSCTIAACGAGGERCRRRN